MTGMASVTIGNLMSWVQGLSPASAAQLRHSLSYFVPNYERTQEFQRGGWDGKRYLLFPDTNHCWRFPTGLLYRVLNWLSAKKIPYMVVRDLPGTEPMQRMQYLLGRRAMGYRLYPYQADAVASIITKHVGRMGGVLRMATGSGKTVVASKILQLQRVPTIILVNTKDLLYQWKQDLETTFSCGIGQVGDGAYDIRDVTVATVQSVGRALGVTMHNTTRERPLAVDTSDFAEWLIRCVQLAIVDEAHQVAAESVYECVFKLANVLSVIGLSASPWRDDGLDILIEAACGPIVYTITASDLIDMLNPLTGSPYLVPPVITAYEIAEPDRLTPAHTDTGVPHEFHKAWIVDHVARNKFIAQLAQQDMIDGRIVLILVKRLEHGKILTDMIPGSRFVEGKNTSKTRKKAYDDVRDGTLRCLVATTLADQGLDLPAVSSLILAGGGRSSTKALQRIGRVIRSAPGKTDARVHDLIDAHRNFKQHYLARERIYKTERRFTITRVRVNREKMLSE